MQIVLARLDEEQVIVKYGRTDLGELHKFKTIPKPVSLMWVNKGTAADVAKAEIFAVKEGYKVFTYQGERNPLERAKREILTAAKNS